MAKGGKKELVNTLKIQAPGGQATPAPPIGPALGAAGVNPGQFIQQFNDATRQLNGKVVGCVISVFSDRTFTFEVKCPPAAVMILDKVGLKAGSGEPNTKKVGKITVAQLQELVDEKKAEMTGHSAQANINTFAGTARSMGIDVVEA